MSLVIITNWENMNTYGFALYALKDPFIGCTARTSLGARKSDIVARLQVCPATTNNTTTTICLDILVQFTNCRYAWNWYSLLDFSTNIFNDSPELGSAKMIEIWMKWNEKSCKINTLRDTLYVKPHSFFENPISPMSCDMRFPTVCYVRPARAQTSLRMRAVCSEPLLVAWIFSEC